MIVGISLAAALNCHWEYISLLGALFVLGAIPGHDKYFSAETGIESSHPGIRWIDFIVDSMVPLRSLDISQSLNKKGTARVKARGALGMCLRGVYYQPLFILTGALSGAGWEIAVAMGLVFQLAYAGAYYAAPYVVRWVFKVPPENSYNVAAEWMCAWALMLCLWKAL